MQKFIPLLKGGFIFSGQEKPTGSKNALRDDLLKKFATGEGIAGRLPYAILTKLILLTGWKRIECNKLFRFMDIEETNFESILRRCAVIKILAKFFDKAFVDLNFKNFTPETYGLFTRDPNAQEFLTSNQAVHAGHQIQMAFEHTYDEAACQKIIDEYTRCGKDRGETLKQIRYACNLPEITTGQKNIGHLLESAKQQEKDKSTLLEDDLQIIYKHYVKELFFGKKSMTKPPQLLRYFQAIQKIIIQLQLLWQGQCQKI